MRTLAIENQKGGVGKTTLAVNVAAAAHLAGRRTLLIDMDRQGSAADWFAARSDESRLVGLAVMKMDRPLSTPKFRELAHGYDFVVLDGPPRADEVTRAAAVAADLVLIPVQTGPFDLWATNATLNALALADEIREQMGRGLVRRAYVANNADVRSSLAAEAVAALAQTGEVLDCIIHQRVSFRRSAAIGESVLTGGDAAAAAEIRALYAALCERMA